MRAADLDEISGIAVIPGSGFVVHNDDGAPAVAVVGADGSLRARVAVDGAHHRDWEDVTVVPGPDGDLLAIGDIGDNHKSRKSILLYFVAPPAPDGNGRFPSRVEVLHAHRLRYPDGARDAEALAFDPVQQRILILSKRDLPPRLYSVPLNTALSQKESLLAFAGDLNTLRPPSPTDLLRDPLRGAWVSQPTGLDISADGRYAAIITYRSLYLYRRQGQEDWVEAFQAPPLEVIGPPGSHEEAVSFAGARNDIIVTTEGMPAPLFRLNLPEGIQPVSMP